MAANFSYITIPVDDDWFQSEVADQVERLLKLKWGEDFVFNNLVWDDEGYFEYDLLDAKFPREGPIHTITGSLTISRGKALIGRIDY